MQDSGTYIRINQIKLPVTHTIDDLNQQIVKLCGCKEVPDYIIVKKSVDARDKTHIQYIYCVALPLQGELKQKQERLLKNPNIILSDKKRYDFADQVQNGIADHNILLKHRPVIVGTGPAGLFCGYMLAKAGYQPLLLERGSAVEERVRKVSTYWKHGILDESCNVQFGEGGAGTFSDGKLNTMTHDKYGRIEEVLRIFAEYGAASEILYLNKPHIGTDVLQNVVMNIRNAIIEMGGEVAFDTCMTGLQYDEMHTLRSITIKQHDAEHVLPCECLVLALGHSARDTFAMLYQQGLNMQAKPFAIGLRIEHPAEMIQRAQYGNSREAQMLPAADYKLTYQTKDGRSVYSFCMCPGGYIVDASSEQGGIAVNGMSNHARNAQNSNSAIVVNVTPEDFVSENTEMSSPLSGMEFQRKWERLAFTSGKGHIPLQLYGDFREGKASVGLGAVQPELKGQFSFANLRECLPNYVSSAIIEGIAVFHRKITGFGREDAVLCGIESRTSSPVRILRGDDFQSNIRGIFPCGEGAGYAGGITSAAVDGMKTAEAVAAIYDRIS